MFGGERGSDAGVSELDLVVGDSSHCVLACAPHFLLVHLRHELDLLFDGHAEVVLDVIHSLLELEFLFLSFFFLDDYFADVGGAYHCYSDVGISESAHVVGAVTGVHYPSLGFLEVLDDNFLVVGGGA